ncbi:MAG TPA: hypothetical protein VE870_05805, partial [Bacteroidales bacterium]|nr:hypothetical protein [Bacteroidales bacterium]
HKYSTELTDHTGELDMHNARWIVELLCQDDAFIPGLQNMEASFFLSEGRIESGSVALEFLVRKWSEHDYLLLPGAAFNGNRFQSRKIPYSPKLLDENELWPASQMIISDVPRLNIDPGPSELTDVSGSLAVPVIATYHPERHKSVFILFEPQNEMGDLGIAVIENGKRDRLTLSLISPVVREKYRYHICDTSYPSHDVASSFLAGYQQGIRFAVVVYEAGSMASFLEQFAILRHSISSDMEERVLVPVNSHSFRIIERKFNTRNWVEEHGYYSVGMRENFLQDWQIGWTGGMISTYPLYFLGGEDTRTRVLRQFSWLFRHGISPSGFFWDSGEKGSRWYGGDIRREQTKNRHLVRKSGDGLFYIMKQFFLFRDEGRDIDSSQVEKIHHVARTFLVLQERYGQPGQFVDSLTGQLVVGGSTSGAIVPAGLCLVYRWTGDGAFLEAAIGMADYFYLNFLGNGISCGGPGDALQNPDSESCYALIESFVMLYETTGENYWLDRAGEAANLFSCWVMSWNYRFPENTPLHKLGSTSQGVVFANTQNKHGSPGICTYSGQALLRLYRYTGEEIYMDLLSSITRAMPQYLSTGERPVGGMDPGWMSERVNTSDWFEGAGELMKGSTWSETSLMLTAAEIPSVYVDNERKKIWCFDQLAITRKGDVFKITPRQISSEKASITILEEDKDDKNMVFPVYGPGKVRHVEMNHGGFELELFKCAE